MTRIGRKIIIAGATTLVLTAGASVATAAVMSSGPVDSSGVIHGCWSNALLNGSHVFVLQDAGTSCPKGTTPISWNEQGPAGSPGPSGPAGPTGAAGPSTAGPSGLDVVLEQGSAGNRSIAYCPADHPYVLGGGYSTYNYEVIASFPVAGNGDGVGSEGSSGNGWEVQTVDYPNGSPPGAYAICAK